MLQQPILSQAGTWTHENANKTSTGNPHWEHYCTRGHSSCLHWKGKDLDYLRASFNQIQPKSYLHSLLNPSVFSFCRVGVKNTDLFGGLSTKLDMDSMCLRELHHSLLKLQDQPKKEVFEKVGRQWAVARVWDAPCTLWELLLADPVWHLYFCSKLSNHLNTELKTSVFRQNNGGFLLLFLNCHEIPVIFPWTINFFIFVSQTILNKLLWFVEIHRFACSISEIQ